MTTQQVKANETKAQGPKQATPKTLVVRTGVQAGAHPYCWTSCIQQGNDPNWCNKICG